MQVVPFFARLKTRLILLVVAGITIPALAIALLCIDWTENAVVTAGRDRNRVVVDEIQRLVVGEIDDLERHVAQMTKQPGVLAALEARVTQDPTDRPVYVLEKKKNGALAGKKADTAVEQFVAGTWDRDEGVRYGTLRGDDGIRRLTVATRVRRGGPNDLLGFAVIQSAGAEMFERIGLISRAIGQGSFAFVLDGEHRILMHSGDKSSPSDLDSLVGSKHGEQEWGEAPIDGEPHFYTIRSAPRAGWTFGLATLSSELLTAVDAGKRTILLTTLIALAVSILAGLVFSAKVTRPITMLHKSVDSFTQGESKFVEVASVDEVGLLCQAYNQLLEDLIASQDSLELALAKTCDMHSAPSARLAETNAKLRMAIATVVGLTEFITDEDSDVRTKAIDALASTVTDLVTVLDETGRLPSVQFGDIATAWVEFSLVKLLEDVAAALDGRHSSAGKCCAIEFATPVPSTVVGDPGAVQRALLNVASYVRDRSTDETVTLKIAYDPEATAQLRIDISDSHADVSEEDLETLFRGFSELEEGDARHPGLTGLSISQRLARLQGGDLVFARPEKSQAPHFFASFAMVRGAGSGLIAPEDLARAIEPRSATRETPDLHGLRILCAEDGPGDFRVVRLSLERAGAQVTSASTADEVIDAVSANSYDAVVLDMDAPGLDGPETATRLRATGFADPILAMATQADITERCQLTACNRYLLKPVSRDDMVLAVHELVSQPDEVLQDRTG